MRPYFSWKSKGALVNNGQWNSAYSCASTENVEHQQPIDDMSYLDYGSYYLLWWVAYLDYVVPLQDQVFTHIPTPLMRRKQKYEI